MIFLACYIVGSSLAVVSFLIAIFYSDGERDIARQLTIPLNAMPTYCVPVARLEIQTIEIETT